MKSLKEYPDVGELVVGTVSNVRDYGAFVKLEEYPGKEGFIHVSEVTTGWVKYIKDHIREGKKIVAKVTDVNESKNQINLSLKRVTDAQKRKKMQEWKNETRGRKLFERLADQLGMTADEAYEQFGYDLIDVFGGIYPAMEAAVIEENVLEEEGFEGDWVPKFVKMARDNIAPPFVSITGTLIISSEEPDGVEVVKEALRRAQESAEEGEDIQIYYVGSPKYRIKVTAEDYKSAERIMKAAADAAIEYMEGRGEGNFAEFDRKGE